MRTTKLLTTTDTQQSHPFPPGTMHPKHLIKTLHLMGKLTNSGSSVTGLYRALVECSQMTRYIMTHHSPSFTPRFYQKAWGMKFSGESVAWSLVCDDFRPAKKEVRANICTLYMWAYPLTPCYPVGLPIDHLGPCRVAPWLPGTL